ncbi:HNH endonuclease [Actinocorallia longicatena]|uniref:HNH endonuclease n=1 Tax=Actinocorallia longicatena TaxID=111803 RepID=A0ABP6Q296_9ACTN
MISVVEADFSARLRAAAMVWLDRRCTPDNPVVSRDELMNFQFDGHRIALLDYSRGIRKPANMSVALSIVTTFTPENQRAPYEDAPGPDGLLRYKYQGDNPEQWDNVSLRRAHQLNIPLIWFYGVAPGLYLPRYPVWIVADEPEQLQCAVAMDEEQQAIAALGISAPQRRYVERMTRQRMHQPVFRERVIHAYATSCTICSLRHASLLDAAHILPDAHPDGVPSVTNGLALCKIHHAAYDQNILGIRPDYKVEIRHDILAEIDGPMLRHGLQEMQGATITLPHVRAERPNREALAHRYAVFQAATA